MTSLRQPANPPAHNIAWFRDQAQTLDQSDTQAQALLPELARQGFPAIGVPEAFGGAGGSTADAVDSIIAVAQVSLTAAFVLWGHRSLTEYILQSPNATLRERWLPALLRGELAGATGLSNAIKYLGGIESLQISATPVAGGWQLHGKLPWVTNLRPAGYLVAAVVSRHDGRPPLTVALHSAQAGLYRSPDLDLAGLRGSNTAAIDINQVLIDDSAVLHDDANVFLPQIRPAFLALQCGLSIGLARAALDAASAHITRGDALRQRLHAQQQALAHSRDALLSGLLNDAFVSDAASLFRLRIGLVDQVRDATQLELAATGGRAYLLSHAPDFIRRWRESAFIPLVTPSLTQLQAQLAAAEPGHR